MSSKLRFFGQWTPVLLVTLCFTSNSHAQDLKSFGIAVDLPASWETIESHTASLPESGVYYAKSDDGGFFWLQVMNVGDKNVHEIRRDPYTISGSLEINQIDPDENIAGFEEGYVLRHDGVSNYLFVSVNEGRLFRFRIGYDFGVFDTSKEFTDQAEETLKAILLSLSFVE